MENKNFMTEEEKHKKAYAELKEIQRKYGFENIAQLREFYRSLASKFIDYDRPTESMRGEEFEPIFKEIFKFIKEMDYMEESEIDKSYDQLINFLNSEKISPRIIDFIKEAYSSRMSVTEKLRRKIIKEGLDIENSLTEYYSKEIENKYSAAFKQAIDFAFDFPTRFSDWTNTELNKMIYSYEDSFKRIEAFMRYANVPQPMIRDFISHAALIPIFKSKIKEARQNDLRNGMN